MPLVSLSLTKYTQVINSCKLSPVGRFYLLVAIHLPLQRRRSLTGDEWLHLRLNLTIAAEEN